MSDCGDTEQDLARLRERWEEHWDRPSALEWLKDPADPRVVEALTRVCSICKAQPRQACRHPWETTEPLNRVVHLARAQHGMDG